MDDHIGFPQSTLKLLQDKNQDKRQQGSNEVEKMIAMAAQNGRDQSVKAFIEHFKVKLISSQQMQLKKSGLLALQSVAKGLVKENTQMAERFVKDLTSPVLECFNDRDEKARLAAVECLLNMSKIFKTMLLINFNDIFEHLLNHAADQDENVSKALCILDNNLKQLVTQALLEKQDPNRQYFCLNKFMPLLHQKMKTKLAQVRTLLTSWIKNLNSNNNNDLYQYLPLLLEGLFMMLAESNKEIRSAADLQVVDFLKQVESKANYDQVTNEAIIDILVRICIAKGNNYAKLSALLWIFEYLRVFQLELEEDFKIRAINSQNFNGQAEISLQRANTVNSNPKETPLRRTILSKLSYILEPILVLLSHEEEEIRKAAQKTNELLLKIMDKIKYSSIEFMNVVPTVKEMLTDKKSSTVESALVWMRHLLQIYQDKLLPTIEDILAKLIDRLNDAESSVVQNVMDVIGSIAQHDQSFDLVIDKILTIFHKHRDLQDKKGELIFKKLCSLINPQKVYATITAKLLITYVDTDIEFISRTIQSLNTLLVSEKELHPLRQILRNLKHEMDEKKKLENLNIFETLFQTFCYNPMSTLTLCFLSEEYELAYNVIISFAEVEVDVDMLCEIAQLINFLESPVFVFLRLQLLEHEKHPYLVKCLFGLMMLLPQGPAFNRIKKRLKNLQRQPVGTQIIDAADQCAVFVDIKKLLTVFRKIRQQYLDLDQKPNENIYF